MMDMKIQSMFNVAVYIRLSREDGDKEESDSVANQRKLLTDYILKQDDSVLYDMYIDDGYTGTDFNRPGFRRMIRDIEDGKVNCVVVKDLSRFGRDYIDTGRYLERYFPEKGVRFISLSDNIDSMKQAYDMLLPIKNIFNEQYARDISKKVQTSVKTRQKAGEFIGSFPSYGYRKSAVDKNKLVIDEYAAAVVRRIFSLYLQGYGKKKIAGILNEEGILCPSEYKRISGENYRNGHRLKSTVYWSYSTINSILHKEIYVGNMVQGTKHQLMRSRQRKVPKEDWIIVEHTHEPIIDQETWEKAQALLMKRTRELNPKKNQDIFAGFIKCGDCGRAMAKNTWQRADASKAYVLYCGTYRRNGKEYCTPHSTPVAVLEEIILSDLKIIIQSLDDLRGLLKPLSLAVFKDREMNDKECVRAESELERIKKLKKGLYEDYRDFLISKEEFLSYRQDYQQKEEICFKELEMLESRKRGHVPENIFEEPWLKRFLDLKEIEELDREIVVEMIGGIEIYENHRIKIIYNFDSKGDLEYQKIKKFI